MTTPFWCLFIIVLLPYPIAFSGVYLRIQQLGTVDNKEPRAQALELSGAAARAIAAQANAWEATAVFSAAVLVAHLSGADPDLSATAAVGFVIARILHPIFYIADLDKLRSVAFLLGLGCAVWLFALAIYAA